MQTTTLMMRSPIRMAGHPQLQSILWVGEIIQPNQAYYSMQFEADAPMLICTIACWLAPSLMQVVYGCYTACILLLMLSCCFPPDWRANWANDPRLKVQSPSVWNHTNPLASKWEPSLWCETFCCYCNSIQLNQLHTSTISKPSLPHGDKPWTLANTVQSRCVSDKLP